VVHLVHRRLRKVQRYFLNPYKPELFGTPVLVRLPARCPAAELYATTWKLVRHLVPDHELGHGRWPFSLSLVKRDGMACARCSWRRGCLGCTVPADPAAPELLPAAEETYGIDWDAQVLEQQYKAKIADHAHEHESVQLARLERSAPERLTQCLDGLVKEEELTAYCRECTKAAGEYTEAGHKKVMQLWGCPPLLALQLKRFQTSQGTGYKLHNLVNFPTRLDLREYLAAGPVTVPNSSLGGARENNLKGWDVPLRARGEEESPANEAYEVAEAPGLAEHSTLSREVTGYELYGVVNHIGGMGSGHYTAFVKCSGRWLCCNDDRVCPISEQDVVSANAYLLFYARSDVVAEEVGLHDVFPAHGAGAVAVDTETVKRKPWLRPHSDDSRAVMAACSSSGFCGVM